MPAFDAEQDAQLSAHLSNVLKLAVDRANAEAEKIVERAIAAERERLARIVETCEPFTDFTANATSGVQDETPDLAATLQALGRAIRRGHHE